MSRARDRQEVERGAVAARPAHADLDDIFRRYAGKVARWAAVLGGPRVDPDDVVQEVFVAAHSKWCTSRSIDMADAAMKVWLYRATALVVKRRRRNERIRRWLSGSPDDYARDVPAAAPSALDALVGNEQAREVWRVLDKLSERQRQVLLLFELEELSGEEIAAITGSRVSTVWVQLHRAREAFLRRARELGTGLEGAADWEERP